MANLIYAFADIMARPLAFILMTAAAIIASTVGFVLHLGDSYSFIVNLAISIITMVIGQAVLCSSKRSSIATDLKLDRIIEILPGDNDAIGSEKELAEDLEALKQEVEERTGNA